MSEFKEGRSVKDVCEALVEDGDVDRLVTFAKICETAERYEDMVEAVKCMATTLSDTPMTEEQRNLFSVAFKNVVGAKRASWRVLDSLAKSEEAKEATKVVAYQTELEEELRAVCKQLLNLIGRKSEQRHGKIFFQKMAGDYHRYMAELESRKAADDRDESHSANALSAYQAAYDTACGKAGAEDGLEATNPIRLGLALNFSVFHYEIRGDPDRACKLAKTAFDDAIAKLDTLDENDYKDSTLIMQLIRDNLTLWENNVGDDGKPEDDGTMVQDVE